MLIWLDNLDRDLCISWRKSVEKANLLGAQTTWTSENRKKSPEDASG